MTEEAQSGPRIVLAFQNYTPPFDAEKSIRRMLRIVPPKFLAGWHTIALTNVATLSRKEREQKTWGRRRVSLGEALGYYSQAWKGEPARITILVDNFEKRMDRSSRHFKFFRDAEFAEVFFPRVGPS